MKSLFFPFSFHYFDIDAETGSHLTGPIVALPARVALHCMAAAWGVAMVMRRVAP